MRPVVVDDADAVGVAVEGDAEVGARRAHALDELLHVLDDRRIGMVVREAAVGLAEERRDARAEPLVEGGRDGTAGAVPGVDDDGDRRGRALPTLRGDVVLVGRDDGATAGPARRRAGTRRARSDRRSAWICSPCSACGPTQSLKPL